jgi:type II secretory pathway pseudopilin PulG
MADGASRSGAPFVVVAVALVGLLSTVGAAALGGYWANRSVERQFESQRNAALQDQRRETYANYLRAAAQVCLALGEDPSGQSQKAQKAGVEVLNQHARARLIAGPGLRAPLIRFTQKITTSGASAACNDLQNYVDEFVAGAQPDLE